MIQFQGCIFFQMGGKKQPTSNLLQKISYNTCILLGWCYRMTHHHFTDVMDLSGASWCVFLGTVKFSKQFGCVVLVFFVVFSCPP